MLGVRPTSPTTPCRHLQHLALALCRSVSGWSAARRLTPMAVIGSLEGARRGRNTSPTHPLPATLSKRPSPLCSSQAVPQSINYH
ncbi:hypothetical protein E2C01_011278 [Portunus trituberculatus]|uniref:Uncharacterized protein n=1 Tax=Portunus trituberculatus TaxID=210409 RepID=A0A5B7DBA3_PORTR|nr:hypothetical protein [Portunus trituberculatus]